MSRSRPVTARGARLSEGMTIAAHVRARVLGMKLLELHADVVVSPAAFGPLRTEVPAAARRRLPRQSGNENGNGRIGSHLGEVAEAIERGELELAEARRIRP